MAPKVQNKIRKILKTKETEKQQKEKYKTKKPPIKI